MVSAEHAIALGNVFADIALMFLAVSSIIIGFTILGGNFSKGVSYVVIISGTLTLLGTIVVLFEPLKILTLFGLILTAVWQIVVGIKLYKLGRN